MSTTLKSFDRLPDDRKSVIEAKIDAAQSEFDKLFATYCEMVDAGKPQAEIDAFGDVVDAAHERLVAARSKKEIHP